MTASPENANWQLHKFKRTSGRAIEFTYCHVLKGDSIVRVRVHHGDACVILVSEIRPSWRFGMAVLQTNTPQASLLVTQARPALQTVSSIRSDALWYGLYPLPMHPGTYVPPKHTLAARDP